MTRHAREELHRVHHLNHAVAHAIGHVGVTRVSARIATMRWHVTHARARFSRISCVPYARETSGITLAGNAWQWWDHAEGTYARGNVPEPGSVLAFRSNGRMRLGHVAVVTRVINDREIEIDHSNWAGGGIAHNVPVVDVSENNDWTAVRVSLGRSDSFGSIYPTYGFIYDRPDTGTMLTSITVPAAQPAINPASRDLRTAAERAAEQTTVTTAQLNKREYDEVAEAPAHPRARLPASQPAGQPVGQYDSLVMDRTDAATR
jgi:CHAP domain